MKENCEEEGKEESYSGVRKLCKSFYSAYLKLIKKTLEGIFHLSITFGIR